MNRPRKTIARLSATVLLIALMHTLQSCKSHIATPSDTKYLKEFILTNFESQDKLLKDNSLSLLVDYSTCNKLGQNSLFFQNISASLVSKTTDYYSIKGDQIQRENLSTNNVYSLLRNIEEVNYADLSTAAKMMASGNGESVLITDGEYYSPSIAKGHDNDPYLANAFKTWILKGHDIHIISEPYVEPYKGKQYSKKRFYIIFTDDRMAGNIFDHICRSMDFTQYPEVDQFHIAASHPQMEGEGNNCSTQNPILESKAKGYGSFEIEDWDGCDWSTIEDNLVNAVDENTGEPLPFGAPIIQMAMDKNSFGCYRIKSLTLRVFDINEEYNDYYVAKESGEKPGKQEYDSIVLDNFMQIDAKEFDKHSKINISFNKDYFDPSVLTGKPYNYFKVDIVIGDVTPIFDQHEENFEFESISQPGTKNVSVASSIKQCLADRDVLNKMREQVIYSIYIKSEAK